MLRSAADERREDFVRERDRADKLRPSYGAAYEALPPITTGPCSPATASTSPTSLLRRPLPAVAQSTPDRLAA
jgi:hypothetical protein